MKKQHQLLLTALTMVLLCAGMMLPCFADNANIPDSLFKSRDQLLKQKDELLDRRDRINRDLRDWDYTLRRADESLRTDVDNRQDILYWRGKLASDIKHAEGQKWDIERALLYNNDDLRRVESEMDRYASYRQ